MLTLSGLDLSGLDLVVASVAAANLHASASAEVEQAIGTAALVNGEHVLAANGAADLKAGTAGRLVDGAVGCDTVQVHAAVVDLAPRRVVAAMAICQGRVVVKGGISVEVKLSQRSASAGQHAGGNQTTNRKHF